MLAIVEGSAVVATPDSPEAANVRELRRGYDRRTRLPAPSSRSWRGRRRWPSRNGSARAASDFRRFQPWLETIFRLKREESACLATGEGGSVYDPLLDDYEPGARSAELSILFDALRSELAPMVASIVEASSRRADDPGAILHRLYPRDRQQVFGEAVAAAVGFDFQRGRLDVTAPSLLHRHRTRRLPDHHAFQ